jgi:hypothetical protein
MVLDKRKSHKHMVPTYPLCCKSPNLHLQPKTQDFEHQIESPSQFYE